MASIAALESSAAIEGFTRLASEITGATPIDLRLRAASLVLRDLLAMGWCLRVEREIILVTPGTSHDGPTKEAIRRQLEAR